MPSDRHSLPQKNDSIVQCFLIGGSGLSATEVCRLAEIFGHDESVGITLLASQTLGLAV